MKPYLYSLIAVAAACGFASAQTTAYTDPVGYTTVPIPGTGGVGTSKLQLASHQLLPSGSTEFAGTVDSFSGNILNDAAGTWSAGAYVNPTPPSGFPNYTHLVEITSGPLTGTFTWITATAANQITTFDNISAAGTANYRVRKAFTIASLLGDPPTSAVLGGGTSSTADTMLLYTSTSGAYRTFYYKTSGAGGTGWRTTASTSVNVSSVAIHPTDSGLVFQRKQSADGSLVINGDVKTGATDVLIRGGGGTGPGATTLNLIQALIPTDQLTLGTCGLYTGNPATGLAGGTSSTADTVLTYNATTGAYTTYYYKTSGAGGTGWRSTASTSVDRSTQVLPSNGAILIQRKNSGTDFTWEMPAVIVGP
jgi:hypothetical protein